ncbi:MAG: hypothetical protein ACTSPQ_19850, partial [Candidatus Helarchaeota archaeon]
MFSLEIFPIIGNLVDRHLTVHQVQEIRVIPHQVSQTAEHQKKEMPGILECLKAMAKILMIKIQVLKMGITERTFIICPFTLPTKAKSHECSDDADIIKEYLAAGIEPEDVLSENEFDYNNINPLNLITRNFLDNIPNIILSKDPFYIKFEKIRLYSKYLDVSDRIRGKHGDSNRLGNWVIGDSPHELLYE